MTAKGNLQETNKKEQEIADISGRPGLPPFYNLTCTPNVNYLG